VVPEVILSSMPH